MAATKEEVREIVLETLQKLQIQVEEKTSYGYGGNLEKYVVIRLLLEDGKDSIVLSEDYLNP